MRLGKRTGIGVRPTVMANIVLETWSPASDDEHAVSEADMRAFALAMLAVCDEVKAEREKKEASTGWRGDVP